MKQHPYQEIVQTAVTLQFTFLILTLSKDIDWPWWGVLSPTWGAVVFALALEAFCWSMRPPSPGGR